MYYASAFLGGAVVGAVAVALYYKGKLKAIEQQLLAEASQAFEAGEAAVVNVVKRIKAKL